MAKSKFRIVGIKEPGKVDIYPYGVVSLFNLSDERLQEILDKTGCSYIKPAIDAPEPKVKITVDKTPRNSNKQTRQKE